MLKTAHIATLLAICMHSIHECQISILCYCRLKLKPTPIHLSCNDVFQLGSDSDHSILSPPPAKRNHDDLSPDAIRSDGDEFVPPAAANSPSDAADYSPGSSDFFLSISTLEVISSH